MSSLTALTQAASIAPGLAQGLSQSLGGHPDLVHFVDPVTGAVLLQLDAVLSEQHSRETPPTAYPLEDGSSISDHVLVTPIELQLQGVITDTPIGGKEGLVTEAVATGVTAALPPLGVTLAAAGYAGFQALQSVNLAGQSIAGPSRSASGFAQLLRIQAGDPTASPPIPPRPFNVVTKLQRYTSMVIRSLSVPRDSTVSGAIVFQASLTQLLVVAPQTANVQVISNKALGAAQANLGEHALSEDQQAQKELDELQSNTDLAAQRAQSAATQRYEGFKSAVGGLIR